MTVHFIGAGPGAADLITVRGLRLIQSCPVVLYAGSLVPVRVGTASDWQEITTGGFRYSCGIRGPGDLSDEEVGAFVDLASDILISGLRRA